MALQAGVALIASGAVLAIAVGFVGWHRLPGRLSLGLMSASGVAMGAGALLVQDEAGPGSWAITLTVLAFVGPLHGRLVLGRPGRA